MDLHISDASKHPTLAPASRRPRAPSASIASRWTSPLAVRALRVGQWLHFIVLPLALCDPGVPLVLGDMAEHARGVLIAAVVLAFAYGLNAVTDRATDASALKNPLVGITRIPLALTACLVCLPCVALALGALGGRAALLATGVSLLASALYSAGPRTKAIFGIGTLTNVAIFTPLLWVGRPLPAGPVPVRAWIMTTVFAALLLQSQLLHEREDASEDRAAGVHAMGAALRSHLGWIVLALAACAVVVVAAASDSPWPAAMSLFALAPPTWVAWHDRSAHARARHRWIGIASGALLYGGVATWAAI